MGFQSHFGRDGAIWDDCGQFAQFRRHWGFCCSMVSPRVPPHLDMHKVELHKVELMKRSFGVGGNLPVDSAIFLEFLPRTHQYLLTVLSIFWALAQLVITLIAWPLLGNLTCPEDAANCRRADNMGWRYLVITAGGIALIGFIIRFFIFHIYESPKYFMGKGRDEDAVRIVHEVARRNGTTSNLTIDDLRVCEGSGGGQRQAVDTSAAIKRKMEKLSAKHIKALFATKKLAFSTGLIMLVWAFIGLAFPLYVRNHRIWFRADSRTHSSHTLCTFVERSLAIHRRISLTETPSSSPS